VAVAAVVAWIVALRQGRTVHENWLKEERFVLYEAIVASTVGLTDDATPNEPKHLVLVDRLTAL